MELKISFSFFKEHNFDLYIATLKSLIIIRLNYTNVSRNFGQISTPKSCVLGMIDLFNTITRVKHLFKIILKNSNNQVDELEQSGSDDSATIK